MQVLLFEEETMDELEHKINETTRKAEFDGYEIIDIKFIPVPKERFICYFGQVTYTNK